MTDALFAPAGDDRWRPTDFSRGPWHRDHCHGGPVSALLAGAVEGLDDGTDIDWQVARLTIELLRPVRVAGTFTVETEIERPGRKVSLVAARLLDLDGDGDGDGDETEVARVRALRIRRQEFVLPDHPVGEIDEMARPGEGRTESSTWSGGDDGVAYNHSSCTQRWLMGSFDDAGPCRVWIRLDVPVVAGESPSGLQRAAAAADFGNGVSGAVPSEEVTYINPDLTIHVARPPVGEWIGLASHSLYGVGGSTTGMGWAESALYDTAGRLGRSVQSLILQPA